jgi:DNA replication protein DnaC
MSTRLSEPECPDCRGTGWKTVSFDRGVPNVGRCECQMVMRVARLRDLADIPRQYEHCTLENFDVIFPSTTQSLSKALLVAKKFVERYPLEKDGLLLHGGCGTGKTHLAIAILKELIDQKGVR